MSARSRNFDVNIQAINESQRMLQIKSINTKVPSHMRYLSGGLSTTKNIDRHGQELDRKRASFLPSINFTNQQIKPEFKQSGAVCFNKRTAYAHRSSAELAWIGQRWSYQILSNINSIIQGVIIFHISSRILLPINGIIKYSFYRNAFHKLYIILQLNFWEYFYS